MPPLDRSVFGPIKEDVNSGCAAWIKTHRGKTISGIVVTALAMAIVPNNITAGFTVTGIFPYNRDIFVDHDFLASYVTDREDPNLLNPSISVHSQPSSLPPGSADLVFSTTPEPVPSTKADP
ncbi:hypothetical protein JTB14_021505 [Gonioctena quinquepunctata]|nr:hypothetical protein JTB14_021505 [Gonioctena quinquepunctata]